MARDEHRREMMHENLAVLTVEENKLDPESQIFVKLLLKRVFWLPKLTNVRYGGLRSCPQGDRDGSRPDQKVGFWLKPESTQGSEVRPVFDGPRIKCR